MCARTVLQPPADLDPGANTDPRVVGVVGNRGVQLVGVEQQQIARRECRRDRRVLAAMQRQRVAGLDRPDRAPDRQRMPRVVSR
jgi:hypothetical protein